MVPVAMDAGRRKDRGQAVQELESGETERCPACGVGLRQEVEDLVRAAADEVESVEGEGRTSAVAKQPFEAGAVGGFDPDAPVQAKTATMLPGQHILGLVGLQEAMATKVAEDPGADGVLEPFEEFGAEAGGFVEVEATGWRIALVSGLGIRIGLDSLEQTIHHAKVVVVVGIERRAEAMQETDRAHRGRGRGCGTGFSQGSVEGPEQDVKDGRGGLGPVVEEGPKAFGDGEDELADGHMGDDVVHQVSRRLGHTLGPARGTGASGLAREDGSYLSKVYPSPRDRTRDREGITVRVIEYQLEGIPAPESGPEVYRLITTLLDPTQAPAQELAALYHERWEIETAFDELKTHLRGRNIVLRSKTPELVVQELYGLLLAHFAVRGLMHEAALRANIDPDTVSFVHAVRVIRRKLPRYVAFPPSPGSAGAPPGDLGRDP